MDVAHLIQGLGGQKVLAEALGLGKSAVGMWVTRGAVPREYHLTLWRMALDAGIAWEPPGADAIRAQLGAAQSPAPAKVA